MCHMFGTAQPMVPWDDVEFDRIARIPTSQQIDKFTAAFRSNHGIA